VADFFEAVVQAYRGEPKTVSNWVTGELFRLLNEADVGIGKVPVTPAALAELLTLVDRESINTNTAKMVLEEMFLTGGGPEEIVARKNLAQISDQTTLEAAITQVLVDNPEQVADYMGGKATVAHWLMGQVMRATRGQANPQVVSALLTAKLEDMRESH
jgi:aspartyl-tRNA(Asn)/glutamyl-tRNA(Gln) amidotransferase subunit B